MVEDIVAGPRQGVRTKIKLNDRFGALRLLAMQHGILSEHRITDVSVVVQAPDLEKMTDRMAALKEFEDFRRRLVEHPPQLPAPVR